MLDMKKLIAKVLDAIKVDYIVKEGTSGVWQYRKWNSGKIEAWGYQYYSSIPINISSAAFGGYRSDIINMAIPSGIFPSTPNYVFLQKKSTQSGSIYFASATSAINIQFIFGGVNASGQNLTAQTIMAYVVQVA